MIWALVPAKLGDNAKERLASALSPELRLGLARAMLTDVLHALLRSTVLAGTVVISRDPEALALATALGATTLHERGRSGLNGAVAEGIQECMGRGATGLLIAMGDLPLLTSADVDAVLERLPDRGVVLTPSFDGTGTNLLAARPPDALSTHFGPESLELHLAAARARDVPVVLCERPGAALDVDTLTDLAELTARRETLSVTRRLLALHGVDRGPRTARL